MRANRSWSVRIMAIMMVVVALMTTAFASGVDVAENQAVLDASLTILRV